MGSKDATFLVNGSVPALPHPMWLCATRSGKINLVLLLSFVAGFPVPIEEESLRSKIFSSIRICSKHSPSWSAAWKVELIPGSSFTGGSLLVSVSQSLVRGAEEGDSMQAEPEGKI